MTIDASVVKRLAVQCGFTDSFMHSLPESHFAPMPSMLRKFAADIAAHQREIDAEFCKSHRIYTKFDGGEKYLVPYIYDLDRHEGVVYAEAIRNLGESK